MAHRTCPNCRMSFQGTSLAYVDEQVILHRVRAHRMGMPVMYVVPGGKWCWACEYCHTLGTKYKTRIDAEEAYIDHRFACKKSA